MGQRRCAVRMPSRSKSDQSPTRLPRFTQGREQLAYFRLRLLRHRHHRGTRDHHAPRRPPQSMARPERVGTFAGGLGGGRERGRTHRSDGAISLPRARPIAREPRCVRSSPAKYFTATEPNELHEIVGVPPGPARCRRGERGCGPDRSGRDRGRGRPLTDSRRRSVQGTTQPFAHLVNILSRPLANDCRSLLVNADGPPVYIPLARNVSMKSRMLSR